MPSREWSPLTTHFQINTSPDDSAPRLRAVVGIGEHHAASPNKLATLDLFRPGGRLVTPNYYVWRTEIWGIIPETRKAHTTSSATYDHSSITKEIANSAVGEPWPFDEETLETVARLDADIAAFYGIPFRHGLPGFWEHRDVYGWTGGRESYQTACAGPSFYIDARIAQAADVGVGSPIDHALLRRQKEDTMYVKSHSNPEVYNVYTDANGQMRVRLCGINEASFATGGGLVITAGPDAAGDATLENLGRDGQYREAVVPDVDVALTDAQVAAISAAIAGRLPAGTLTKADVVDALKSVTFAAK